jgi:hypothetical protein
MNGTSIAGRSFGRWMGTKWANGLVICTKDAFRIIEGAFTMAAAAAAALRYPRVLYPWTRAKDVVSSTSTFVQTQ